MSLRDVIESRRASQPALPTAVAPAYYDEGRTVSEKTSALSLAIDIPSKGEHWDLPWTCCNGACFSASADAPDGSGKMEKLSMFYSQHEVIVYGKNLLALRKAIGAMSLGAICETPPSQCAAAASHGEPFVANIAVKPRDR